MAQRLLEGNICEHDAYQHCSQLLSVSLFYGVHRAILRNLCPHVLPQRPQHVTSLCPIGHADTWIEFIHVINNVGKHLRKQGVTVKLLKEMQQSKLLQYIKYSFGCKVKIENDQSVLRFKVSLVYFSVISSNGSSLLKEENKGTEF